MLGAGAASVVFGVALLASGQNSTVTGTLAGQIVMEGFLDLRLAPWLRRLITRGLAIIPAVLVVGASGQAGATKLLVLSQVVLSLQLPFAVVPLVRFTADKGMMGPFASPSWLRMVAWFIAAIDIALNLTLLWVSRRADRPAVAKRWRVTSGGAAKLARTGIQGRPNQ